MKTTLIIFTLLFGFNRFSQKPSYPTESEKWYYECETFTEFNNIDSITFCSTKDENGTDWCYWNMKEFTTIGISNYNLFDGVFLTKKETWSIEQDTLLIGDLIFKIQVLSDSTFIIKRLRQK